MFLRKCRSCGKEAITEEDLLLFRKDKTGKYGRQNQCLGCLRQNLKDFNEKYGHIKNNIETTKKRNQRRLQWTQNERHSIILDKNFRTNICSKCGKKYPDKLKRQTHFHHLKYTENEPIKDTVELCGSCHVKQHMAEEKNNGEKNRYERRFK